MDLFSDDAASPTPISNSLSASIVKVALPIPKKQLFDYKIDLPNSQSLIGFRVQVPFGGRHKLVGIVIEHANSSEHPEEKLRNIDKILDQQPSLQADLLELAKTVSQYYHHPLGEVVKLFLPSALNQGKSAQPKAYYAYRLSGQAPPVDAIIHGKRQQELITLLRANQSLAAEAVPASISSATIKRLLDKGWVEKFKRPVTGEEKTTSSTNKTFLKLDPQQSDVYQHMQQHDKRFAVHLLHGVTGSGKTEVYLHCIRDCLERQQQALVLVPEIGLTPQTIGRFAERFSQTVLAYHSDMTDQERLDVWLKARSGFRQCAVVIGTRSASFLPFVELGMIIVDEEHDLSFKQQEGFRYSARDLAILRSQQSNIPIILGSATPTLESLHNCQKKHYHYLPLTTRTNNASLPTIEVLDVRKRKMIDGIAEDVIARTASHLARQEQVLFFINRRGFSPLITCHDCGWTAQCQYCDANMVLHVNPMHLHCHHCARQAPIPEHCPDCNSHQLLYLGMGTEKTEHTLSQVFPNYRVLRIDRDSTQGKNGLNQALKQISEHKVDLIVGTQMLAKGHHFPNLTLVVVLNIDTALFAADFRAPERAAQLVFQVAGRAGRGEKPGHVLMQTHHPDDPLFAPLVKQEFNAISQQISLERQRNRYPPYSFQALFRAEHKDENLANQLLEHIKALSQNNALPGLTMMGPIPAPLSRRAGRYRFNLLLQSEARKILHQHLDYLLKQLSGHKLAQRIKWSLDVDPQDMN